MRKRTIVLLIVALLFLISFQYDNQIVKGVSEIRNNFLNSFFSWVTLIGSKEIVFLFFTCLFLFYKKNRQWIFPLWFTLLVSAVVGFILKVLIQRPRPFQQGIVSIISVLEKANHSTWNFSFPSSHTLIAFCMLPLLSKQFPKLKKLWFIFAVLVGLSRVYLGVHFLSDVIAGGIIGYFIGAWIIRLAPQGCTLKNFLRNFY